VTSPPPDREVGALQLQPFRGLHLSPAVTGRDLADVTLDPPALWDFAAMSGLAASSDHHVLRLLAPSLTGGSSAPETAAGWLASGALTADRSPGLYAWRWSSQGRSVVGVAGALPLPAPDVWPHEQVRPGLLAERATELGSGAVQAEPILLLYDGWQPLLDGTPEDDSPPLVEVQAPSGSHQVSAITEPEPVAAVNAALAGSSLVVADGHHRFALLGGRGRPRTRAFVLVVDQPRSELTVGPIPRVAGDVDWEKVWSTPGARLVELAEDTEADFLAEGPSGRLRWVLGDPTWTVGLEMTPGAAAALGPARSEPCGPISADICSLHADLLPWWGVPPERVHYAHSWDSARTDAGARRGLAVAGRPPQLREVMAAARSGTLLPHKATSIAPKPRAGLLMLGDGLVGS